MIPRTHTCQCTVEEWPSVKKKLKEKGFEVYDPIIFKGKAYVTYENPKVNIVAMQNFLDKRIR